VNKKLVLRYLVPVKLILGKCPTRRLLDKYGLEEYKNVVEAVKRGNVRQLNDALVGLTLFTFILQYQYRLLTASNVHVTNLIPPGSDNPTRWTCTRWCSSCRARFWCWRSCATSAGAYNRPLYKP
jgi:hypothetical protein